MTRSRVHALVAAVLCLVASHTALVAAQCAASATSDSYPANPGIAVVNTGPFTATSGCSEVVEVVTQGSYPNLAEWELNRVAPTWRTVDSWSVSHLPLCAGVLRVRCVI
jgi:hypothetical protein